MEKLFGTDGIRGVANSHPMTIETAMKVGCAAAHIFRNGRHRPKIIIGKDTRLSGYMLEYALTAGLCSMGVDALLVGPLPTPAIAFITQSMRADAGVVISASHNPFEYNGIKLFGRDGFKLPDDAEARIEALIASGALDALPRPAPTEIGRARRIEDALGRYVVSLKNTFPRDLTLEGVTLVLDTANGAAYRAAPAVFEELGARVVTTGDRPDGKNINDGCGSLHPHHMAELVRRHGAQAGLAFDGDADRLIMADERGEILDGDFLMAICAAHAIKNGTLRGNTLVGTVMSNLGLEVAMRRLGGRLLRTAVGDRYVVERMLAEGYNLGGEQSGHLLFLDHGTTGDGILSALQVLAVMLREGKPLSELSRVMERYPQKLVNIRGAARCPLDSIPEYVSLRDSLAARLGETGRLLVRPSGTEPVIRIMGEGPDAALIDATIEEMACCIRKFLA